MAATIKAYLESGAPVKFCDTFLVKREGFKTGKHYFPIPNNLPLRRADKRVKGFNNFYLLIADKMSPLEMQAAQIVQIIPLRLFSDLTIKVNNAKISFHGCGWFLPIQAS